MTITERLDRTINEIKYYFKQIIAYVPEPITEEVSEGIKKSLPDMTRIIKAWLNVKPGFCLNRYTRFFKDK